MSVTWRSKDVPPGSKSGLIGSLVGIVRGLLLVGFILIGLMLLLVVRIVEGPLFRPKRPVTPWITRFVCRWALIILGIRYTVRGRPMAHSGALVANHSSWLDIFALNASTSMYFVSKAEVASWPGIGWLARATGTLFIKRERQEARSQVKLFAERLSAGHRLVFFPEGTSTDGLLVLPFKPTLFASFLDPSLDDPMLQAVTLVYHAPKGQDVRFYGWWGDMDLGPHLWSTLTATRQGMIEVVFHDPVKAVEYSNRKALAKTLEDQVRSVMPVRT